MTYRDIIILMLGKEHEFLLELDKLDDSKVTDTPEQLSLFLQDIINLYNCVGGYFRDKHEGGLEESLVYFDMAIGCVNFTEIIKFSNLTAEDICTKSRKDLLNKFLDTEI